MFQFSYHILLLILKAAFTLKKSAQETVSIMKDLEQKHQGKFDPSAIKKAARFQGIQQVFINDAFTQLVDRNSNSFESDLICDILICSIPSFVSLDM
mgnify:CR=1 FL=1